MNVFTHINELWQHGVPEKKKILCLFVRICTDCLGLFYSLTSFLFITVNHKGVQLHLRVVRIQCSQQGRDVKQLNWASLCA